LVVDWKTLLEYPVIKHQKLMFDQMLYGNRNTFELN